MTCYFEDEARWSSVTSSHLLKEDCVDAQTRGRVGRLTQQPGGQTDKQETPQEVSTTTRPREDVHRGFFQAENGL